MCDTDNTYLTDNMNNLHTNKWTYQNLNFSRKLYLLVLVRSDLSIGTRQNLITLRGFGIFLLS